MRIELPNTVSLLLLAIVAAILTAVAAWLPGECSGAYIGLATGVIAAIARAIQVWLDSNKKSDATRSISAADAESKSLLREWLVG